MAMVIIVKDVDGDDGIWDGMDEANMEQVHWAVEGGLTCHKMSHSTTFEISLSCPSGCTLCVPACDTYNKFLVQQGMKL